MSTSRIVTGALIAHELEFTFARSGGAGGQNVNKVNTKVVLKFDITNSNLLTAEQKELLLTKLASHLTSAGVLLITSQESRSQLLNREAALQKLEVLLRKAQFTPKKRKPTKPTKAAGEKRLTSKKKLGEKKRNRRRTDE